MSLTDTDAADGYPIATFTWILVYKEQNYDNRPQAKVEAMMKMIWWMTHEGQQYAEALSYAKLPTAVVDKAEAILRVGDLRRRAGSEIEPAAERRQ